MALYAGKDAVLVETTPINDDTQALDKERIQRLDQLHNEKTQETYFVPTANSNTKVNLGLVSHVVLKVRRIISENGSLTGTEIDIMSSLLKDTLVEFFKDIEWLKLNVTPPIISPEMLFHAREDLADRVKAEESKPAPNYALVDELRVALQYIAHDYASTQATLSSLLENNEITFDLLWALFPPNIPVYTKNNLLQEHQICKLQKGEYGKLPSGAKCFDLNVTYISHDGEKLGWVPETLQICHFDGAKKVCNLSVVPLKLLPMKDAVCTEVTTRGKKYLEFIQAPKGTYLEYIGAAVTENLVVVHDEYLRILLHVSGRVMLDPSALLQQNGYTDLLKPAVESEVDALRLTSKDLLYCNHCIGGYGFRQRKWYLFAISHLTPVIWNLDAFSKVAMDAQKRNLIQSLVKSHWDGPETFDDVVNGKGKGLVGHLSGNPGVGKTLTAEAIAEITKRPLLMLSAGELGTQAYDTEKKLDMVLEIARQWGCVLLIDEADTFLQERDGHSLTRNAMVCVFLRRLEHFQGILIMITNRKRIIDPAFNSRIHFKVHYPDLSLESRSMIWRNCFENVPSDLSMSEVKDDDLLHLASAKVNGRQIKNAMDCAVSIARAEKTPLTLECIQTILDMVVDEEDSE